MVLDAFRASDLCCSRSMTTAVRSDLAPRYIDENLHCSASIYRGPGFSMTDSRNGRRTATQAAYPAPLR